MIPRCPWHCLRPQALSRCAWGSSCRQLYVVTSLFDDWKRFCFVLREIASGENGRPLASFEAQKRAKRC